MGESIKDSQLQNDDLSLAELIDGETWQAGFEAYEIDCGSDVTWFYTPAIALWVAAAVRK